MRPTQHALFAQSLSGRGKRFVKRIYPVRCIGLALGFICVVAGFWQTGASPWLWGLLVAHGFIWPHLAYVAALRSREPYLFERRNLLVDALFGGFWFATMQFNLVPGAVIIAMISMDNVAAGGVRLLLLGIGAHVAGALLGGALIGWQVTLEPTLPVIIASMPMLLMYPLALGYVTYNMSAKLASNARVYEHLSRHDGLTGLPNRTYWKALVQKEFDRCIETGAVASVVMLDLDHFKNVNDTHGHQAGDRVIQAFADIISKHSRPGDLLCRYGGEEFGMLLPRLNGEQAQRQVEQLLDAVRKGEVSASLMGCTASAGVSTFSSALRDPDAWLAEADRALYEAKRQGRNRQVLGVPTSLLGNAPAAR